MIYKDNMDKTFSLIGFEPSEIYWGDDEKNNNFIALKRNCISVFLNLMGDNNLITILTSITHGFELAITDIFISLRNVLNNIKIVAVIPYPNQEKKWSEKNKLRYRKILKNCDEQIIISEKFTPTCLKKRDKFLIDNSTHFIACYNGMPGRTRNAIHYAKEKGVKITILIP